MAERTQIDALNPGALMANVKLLIDNEMPSMTRFVKPYLPSNLKANHGVISLPDRMERSTYGSLPPGPSVVRCRFLSCSHVSISTVTSSNC